ncbi:hypothetical protein OF83DRAFT_1175700 [Amylostereum chailletii]|nr:hypothetical protein OF83DRAFT_1175700 [Amylostereum chailletii]
MSSEPTRPSARRPSADQAKNSCNTHASSATAVSVSVSYPEGPPSSPFERTIAALDAESSPHLSYSAVDDVLVYALFAAKRRPRYSRARVPPPASNPGLELRPVTREDGLNIHAICRRTVDNEHPTPEQCHRAAVELVQTFPVLFLPHEGHVVQQ